jgi:hypothetical protein
MDSHIRQILSQITLLEDELRTALHDRETPLFYQVKGHRIEFTAAIRKAHREMRTGLLRWIASSSLRNLLVAPVIYAVIVPLALVDLGVTLYQAICFPVYRIGKIRRADYIGIGRHHLGYLNFIERFNCNYCAYANGVLAYATEIAARTEQYFCPIKHARKILGSHSRYARFLEYGDAADYPARLAALRRALQDDRPG